MNDQTTGSYVAMSTDKLTSTPVARSTRSQKYKKKSLSYPDGSTIGENKGRRAGYQAKYRKYGKSTIVTRAQANVNIGSVRHDQFTSKQHPQSDIGIIQERSAFDDIIDSVVTTKTDHYLLTSKHSTVTGNMNTDR